MMRTFRSIESAIFALFFRRVFNHSVQRVRLGIMGIAMVVLASGAWAATCTVSTLADSGANSLRFCLGSYSPGDTIDLTNISGTITLASPLPAVASDVTIVGPGANALTISGANTYQVFTIASGRVGISGLTIADGNAGGSNGGAIKNLGSTLMVSNVTFKGNSGYFGGAIFTESTLFVTGSTFSNNTAPVGAGGAIWDDSCTVTVTNSTFSGNSVGGSNGSGGGIANGGGGTLTVTNSTFSGNSSPSGGGISVLAGTATVNNSIFSSNTANVGAGIDSLPGTTNGSNNVYYNNLARGSEDDCFGNCNTGSPGSDGNVLASANPLAFPLTYYGGTTKTFLPQPGSAAICAGSASLASSVGLITDQRGFAMNPAYTQCAAGSVDAGAVQANYIQVQSSGDAGAETYYCPGASCTLRDAVALANGHGYGDIDFQSGLTPIAIGSTIELSGTTGINVIGFGAGPVIVNGGGPSSNFSVITVDANVPALLFGLTISNGNTSTNGGGIYNGGMLTVAYSTISGNHAVHYGGGIENTSTLQIVESTIAGNSVGGTPGVPNTGGGIHNLGTLSVVNSTIVGNSVNGETDGLGAGICLDNGSASLANSVVSANSTATGNYANITWINGSFSDDGGNVIGGSTNATDDLVNGTGAQITLSSLQYNGGSATVQTMIPLPGSPAICAGLTANVLSGVSTDERGYPLQPASGYCPQATVDAGAVQTNYTSVDFSPQQPSDVALGAPMSPTPEVELLETDTLLASNNTDAVNGIPLTLSYTGSGTLQNGTATTSGGVATFTGLDVNTNPDMGATLGASVPVTPIGISPATTLTATSNSFNVIGPATVFLVTTPGTATVGVPFSVTVKAEDAAGNLVIGYTGTVHFTSTDLSSSAVLPLDYTFVAADHGVHIFTNGVTLAMAGNQSVTATDTAKNSITGTAAVTVGQGATTTVVSSIPLAINSWTVDQPVTFTATVTPTAGIVPMGGTVTFTDGGNPISDCSSPVALTWDHTNHYATATCTATALTAGSHDVVGVYNGDSNYTGSTSSTVSHAVTTASTTVTMTPAGAAIAVDGSVTFTATVAPSTGSVSVPFAGTMAFSSNGTTIAGCSSQTVNTTTGVATCTTTALLAGNDTITAIYSGDSNYNISPASTATTQSVNKASTTTVVSSNPSSSWTVDQPVTFTATVTPPSGVVALGGTVTFTDGANPIAACSSPVALTWNSGSGNATATCTTSAMIAGSHAIVGVYNGDSNYNTSTSNTVTQSVSKASTTTVVSSNPSSSWTVNQPVTFTATVTPPSGAVALGGTVTFTDGTNPIAACSSPVALTWDSGSGNATATCTTSAMIAGSHAIVGVYNGDSNYNTSTSATVSQLVSALAATLGVTASPSSSTYVNDTVTFTAQLAGASFTPVIPAGIVNFTANGSTISGCGAVAVNSSGAATCTTASLAAGSDPITATYSGDANFTVASAGTMNQTVTSRTSTTASAASVSYSTGTQSVNLSAAVTSDSGTVNASTVTFTVLNGGTVIGSPVTSGTVANGAASAVYALPAGAKAGSYTIQAVFNAGSYYATSTDSSHMLSILKLTPTITWAAPSAITYGTPLSATQLDASTNTDGTFAYTPASGAVLDAGAQTLSVTFTPTDTTDYTTATQTASLTVNPASPALALTCTEAVYDASPHTCSGAATGVNNVSVAGTWGFSPASETNVGSYTISGTFTSGDSNYRSGGIAKGTLKIDKATPTITWATPAAILYGTALSSTQLDATASVPGSFVYTPAAGNTPAPGYVKLSTTFTPSDQANYNEATSTVTLTVNSPVPVMGSISPAFTSAGGSAVTLTVTGSEFMANSVVYWGTAALATTYVSATQLKAQVPASDLAASGNAAITVQTPAPGGGASGALYFEVDSAGSTATPPNFTSLTATVTAGATASYPVTLPSTVNSVTVTCLNLPAGAACSYSSTTNIVTITTSSTTPKGTYQVTVVFTETLSGAATAGILLPVFLLPLLMMRRKLAAHGVWLTACLGIVLMTAAALSIGCGGHATQTHQVLSSGTVSLVIH